MGKGSRPNSSRWQSWEKPRFPTPCSELFWQASMVTGLKDEFMMTKHSLLSLWSGLEGVKGTHRITKKASSSFPSRKGKGQMEEVSQHTWWVMTCISSLGPSSSSLALFSEEAGLGRGEGKKRNHCRPLDGSRRVTEPPTERENVAWLRVL